MPDPVNDAGLYINYPIDTPASREIMSQRPLFHNLMQNDTYFAQYHSYFDELSAAILKAAFSRQKLPGYWNSSRPM